MSEITWDDVVKEFMNEEKNCGISGKCPAQEPPKQSHVELRCASWLRSMVDPAERRKVVELTRVRLCDLPAFDAIAFTGLSGSVIAGAVALAMDKYLYCVRKSKENRHSDYVVEGPSTGLRYIILDDFISTGSTIRRIVEMVQAHTDNSAKCVGAYMWRDEYSLSNSSLKTYL